MKHGITNPRALHKGMGEAVARRTYLRKFALDGKPYTKADHLNNAPFNWEDWGQVAERVSAGNCSLSKKVAKKEQKQLQEHIANASILMSGRHLQHGDMSQKGRPLEVFTNCSTASVSFMKFYLLLNGSGVGRCYDDDMLVVDWSKMPYVHVCLSEKHSDFDYRVHESLEQAQHKYGKYGTTVFTVADSREGWAKALEYLESLTFEGGHENDILLFDFSNVRPKGALIGGMQLRPSSGPIPTMNAFNAVASLKGCLRPLWWQAMYVDHYMAESVLVGGARRSARIAVKHWRDPDILDYINMKAKIGNSVPLWSANNTVGVDEEFWAQVDKPDSWAETVFEAVCKASYEHGTGEPGFVNLHKLCSDSKGESLKVDVGSSFYTVTKGLSILQKMVDISRTKKYSMILNPCGEITLHMLGAYCVIGDIVPFHCDTIEEAIEAAKLTTRALIRTNLMDSVYHHEVKRTNRIGVGITGIHEFAWKFFGLDFKSVLDPIASIPFWKAMASIATAVRQESVDYSDELGVQIPHTCLTIKPSGSISKLFGLTEGAHLPSMLEYLRWVQFRSDDPLIKKYKKNGYKTKTLSSYEGTTIVGFPTRPVICELGMGDKLITANNATVQEQFTWLRLLERYWINAGELDDTTFGNQVSYTLKYNKNKITLAGFKKLIRSNQPHVRCCSVMPTDDNENTSAYEYLPEEPISLSAYNEYVSNIKEELEEDIDAEHLKCAGGACPIDVKERGE